MSGVVMTIPGSAGSGEGEWRSSSELGEFTDYLAIQRTGGWVVFAKGEPSVLDAAGEDTLEPDTDYTIRKIADSVYVLVVITETLPITLEYPGILAHYMGPVVDGSEDGWEPYHAASYVVEQY